MRIKRTMAALSIAATALALSLTASPAYAAQNDDFAAATGNGCGVVNFLDYGPGAPGGGNNDDYLVIHDYCADGHGVKAWAWLNGIYLGGRYNGNGLAGAPVIWDPFKPYGNVIGGDRVDLTVCLVDGDEDPTPFRCGTASHISKDG